MPAARFSVHSRERLLAVVLSLTMALACGCSQTAKPSGESIEQMPATEPAPGDDQSNASPTEAMSPISSSEPTPAPVTKPVAPPKKIVPKSTSEAKRVEFAPHIVIDWSIPRVEIDAEVALTEGSIELLLCGRGTKEHESILVTDASPRRVFDAMGLIGLSPGSPVQYDDKTDTFLPPRGDRVTIDIEYDNQVIGAHEWMLETRTHSPANPINWVFAGSRDVAGRFGANGDGTIVCVVNFDTALIAPDALHTSDDSALWLAASDQRVPPVGTRCRVFIRAAEDQSANIAAKRNTETPSSEPDTGPMELTVTPEGNFHWGEQLLSPIELDEIIRRRIERNPDQSVHLTAIPGTDSRLARVAARCIVGSGIKQDRLTLELPDDGDSGSSESSNE